MLKLSRYGEYGRLYPSIRCLQLVRVHASSFASSNSLAVVVFLQMEGYVTLSIPNVMLTVLGERTVHLRRDVVLTSG